LRPGAGAGTTAALFMASSYDTFAMISASSSGR
jgi:hypothetical protein